MSKQEGKVLSDFVHSWVNGTDGKVIRNEVHKWTKPRKETAKESNSVC